MAAPLLLTGAFLDGRYVVKGRAAQGAHRVYRVRDSMDAARGPLVAKELVLSGLDVDDRATRRALLLAAIAQVRTFDHPHLCPVIDAFVDGSRAYVVMQEVKGLSLAAVLELGHHGLREASVLRWAAQIADALSWLHRRDVPFFFGDLDPAHVILTPQDDVVLVDFGLQRCFRGAPAALDGDDDQRALGSLMLRLLLAEDPTDVARVAHASTADIVARLLGASQPYRDMAEARDALAAASAALHPPSAPLPKLAAAAPPRLPVLPMALLLLSLVLVVWALRATVPPPLGARLWVVDGDNDVVAIGTEGSRGQVVHVAGRTVTEVRHVARDDTLVLAASEGLLFVEPDTGAMAVCPLGATPRSLLLSPDERQIFCISGAGTVVQVVLASHRQLASWTLEGHLTAMALSADGERLFVSDAAAGLIHTIDVRTRQRVARSPIDGAPGPLLVEGHVLWSGRQSLRDVCVFPIDPSGRVSRTPQSVVAVDDVVDDLRFTPDRRWVYGLCRDSHRIVVIDARARAVSQSIDLIAWQPRAWTMSSNPDTAYVVSDGSSAVDVLDLYSHRFARSLTFTGRPRAIDAVP